MTLKDYSRYRWRNMDFKDLYGFKVGLPMEIHDELYVQIICNEGMDKELKVALESLDIKVIVWGV